MDDMFEAIDQTIMEAQPAPDANIHKQTFFQEDYGVQAVESAFDAFRKQFFSSEELVAYNRRKESLVGLRVQPEICLVEEVQEVA